MESQELTFYVQLLFEWATQRNHYYGKPFLPLGSTGEPLSAKDTFEVLSLQKGIHSTGHRNFIGIREKLPTIELVLQVYDEEYLDSLLEQQNHRVGVKRKIHNATLAFTTEYERRSTLDQFVLELKTECKNEEVASHTLDIRTFEGLDANHVQQVLHGYINGPARQVLHIHDFAKNRGIKYQNFSITYS